MSLSLRSILSVALALAVVATTGVSAQPAATYKTGTEFYLAYRAAFDKAKTVDEILPWMAKARRDQAAKTPAADRTQMFDMIKEMDDNTGIKVVKETATATGAELQVEATSGPSKSKATGVITLVKEGGAWRLDRESWKGSL